MDFIFDPSLVLYLPLYELDGASFVSKDTYGQLCTVTGALWTPRGRSFDGSDDGVDCGTSDVLEAGSGNQTIEAWIKTSASIDQAIVYMETVGGDQVSFRVCTTGVLRLNCYTPADGKNASDDTSDTVNDGNWHHVVGIWLRTSMRIFIDATERSLTHNGTYPTLSLTPNQKDIGLRSSNNTSDFNGLIGEVRIYSRALSPLEIQHNYLATKWRYR